MADYFPFPAHAIGARFEKLPRVFSFYTVIPPSPE